MPTLMMASRQYHQTSNDSQHWEYDIETHAELIDWIQTELGRLNSIRIHQLSVGFNVVVPMLAIVEVSWYRPGSIP